MAPSGTPVSPELQAAVAAAHAAHPGIGSKALVKHLRNHGWEVDNKTVKAAIDAVLALALALYTVRETPDSDGAVGGTGTSVGSGADGSGVDDGGADGGRLKPEKSESYAQLESAEENHDISTFVQLLEKGADPNAFFGYGPILESCVLTASERGHVKFVDALIRAGADVNYASRGTTLLHNCAAYGLPRCAKSLLAGRADPTRSTEKPDNWWGDERGLPWSNTPLEVAERMGHAQTAAVIKGIPPWLETKRVRVAGLPGQNDLNGQCGDMVGIQGLDRGTPRALIIFDESSTAGLVGSSGQRTPVAVNQKFVKALGPMTYAAAEARPPAMTEPGIMSEIEYYNDFRACDFMGCEEPGLKTCSGCRDRFYCSREHQAADWKMHKKDCKRAQEDE